MEVVPLREMKTQHDFTLKGRMLRLRIDSCCHKGFTVSYIVEEKLPDDMPPFVLKMMGFEQKDGKIEKEIVSHHVHPKWYDKYIGKTIETRVKEKIHELKTHFKDAQEQQEKAKRLAETL